VKIFEVLGVMILLFLALAIVFSVPVIAIYVLYPRLGGGSWAVAMAILIVEVTVMIWAQEQ
jgi:hypothetical protein